MNNEFIPVMKPKLPNLNLVSKFIANMDTNQIYSNQGPILLEAERKLSEFLGVDPDTVALCTSATQGMIGLASLSNVPGYMVPNFSFLASPLSMITANKDIVLCDVNKDLRIDLDTELVVPDYGLLDVMAFGDNYLNFTDYAKFPNVIIDAAASLANFQGILKNIPTNISIVFSLHATKIMGIGEGGLVFSSDKGLIRLFKQYINFGFGEHRIPQFLGTNGKLSEISSCYILSNLENWLDEKNDWQNVNKKINSLQNELKLTDISINHRGINPYWIIQLDNLEIRNRLKLYLFEKHIETRLWWQCFHSISYLKPYSSKSSYTNSKNFYDTQLGLPKFRGMTSAQVDRIYQALVEFQKKFNLKISASI
jgi:dTDP-4-amino-4,6-dideoxygalactose transaminase